MTRVIVGISGKASAGKDTTAEMIAELLLGHRKVIRIGFADALKEECRAAGWDGKKDDAGRALLQRVGVERRQKDSLYWVHVAFAKMTDPDAIYTIPDVRFQNEANAIQEAGGELWRVTRYNPVTGARFDNGLDAEARAHISETDLDNFPFDRRLYNTTLGGLRAQVRTALGL